MSAEPSGSDQISPAELARGPWIDNHCHITSAHLDGEARPGDVAEAARRAGVVAMITVGTDADSSEACLELAASTEGVWATAGVHPHDSIQGLDALRRVIDAGLVGGRLVAIGECGLDYFYDHSPRPQQRVVFAEQIRLANELDLPLVIHTREAWDDTFEILDAESVPRRTVFHCFTGGPAEAARALAIGAKISISGIVTFPSAGDLRDAVSSTPLQSLMVETDSPFLAPVPHRGHRNEPAHVGLVGAEVARLHECDLDVVATTTTATASDFYGLGVA